jgi:multisubunit Na+/H+ antiporter MnhC subunit
MRLLFYAALVMLAGIGVLLAMVIRLTEPSLGLSLIAYAAICAGMGLGLAGAVQSERRGH